MLQKTIDLLKECQEIHGYLLVETKTESGELFLIKQNLDMDRGKKVHKYKVTVYVDFEEQGKQYRGSSSFHLHPTMTEEEIQKAISDAAYAASFVKNHHYPLVRRSYHYQDMKQSNFHERSFKDNLQELCSALYKTDIYEKGGINSAEIFINKEEIRLVNSQGVDVRRESYNAILEYISTWKEEGEETELYDILEIPNLDTEFIEQSVNEMLEISKAKAIAKPLPSIENGKVILTKKAVDKLLRYYTANGNAKSIYMKTSNWDLGNQVQGDDVEGDKISLWLDPIMEHSGISSGFDKDGFPVEKVAILKEGELVNLCADVRHGFYLNVRPTGDIHNILVAEGSKTMEEMRAEASLEVVAFSDFHVDNLTGDFGGEIRLAWLYEKGQRYPVTGGSVSGNINDVQQDLYLSKETHKFNGYHGPYGVLLSKIQIAPVE